MEKKYIVRLNDAERQKLEAVVKNLATPVKKSGKLKADAEGPAWTDAKIAAAFGCRTKTVENVRQRLVEFGFEQTLNGKTRAERARPKCLSGEEVAATTTSHNRLAACPDESQ